MADNVPPGLETGNNSGVPATEPARVVGEGYLTCDFCECKLTKRGEVYQMSPKSKAFRDADESHEKAIAQRDEEIARLNSDVAAKDREITALKSSVTPSKVKMM